MSNSDLFQEDFASDTDSGTSEENSGSEEEGRILDLMVL